MLTGSHSMASDRRWFGSFVANQKHTDRQLSIFNLLRNIVVIVTRLSGPLQFMTAAHTNAIRSRRRSNHEKIHRIRTTAADGVYFWCECVDCWTMMIKMNAQQMCTHIKRNYKSEKNEWNSNWIGKAKEWKIYLKLHEMNLEWLQNPTIGLDNNVINASNKWIKWRLRCRNWVK